MTNPSVPSVTTLGADRDAGTAMIPWFQNTTIPSVVPTIARATLVANHLRNRATSWITVMNGRLKSRLHDKP